MRLSDKLYSESLKQRLEAAADSLGIAMDHLANEPGALTEENVAAAERAARELTDFVRRAEEEPDRAAERPRQRTSASVRAGSGSTPAARVPKPRRQSGERAPMPTPPDRSATSPTGTPRPARSSGPTNRKTSPKPSGSRSGRTGDTRKMPTTSTSPSWRDKLRGVGQEARRLFETDWSGNQRDN